MMKTQTAFALAASAVFLCSSFVIAQAPVASREAVPVDTSGSTQLVLELQSLRQEISMLRGTIEELEYQVQKLEKKQQENYADLDGRVAGLYSGQTPVDAPIENNVAESAPFVPLDQLQSTNAAPEPVNSSASSEQESKKLYDQGFSALRQGDRETAVTSFNQLVSTYPDSRQAPDARYWLGETYWLANKKEQSRQAFVQLLELAPDYRKAGDAMYRLGVIYDQLGDFDTAFDYMSQVLLSGSSQSVAAQAWINDHQPKNNTDTSTEPSSATPINE